MTTEMLTATRTNPFPGLRPFEFDESHLFFGRDGQSEQVLRKLSATRFVAIVGTSGSGKSSLARAGLLPELYGGMMPSAGSNWRVAIMRPGNDPIGELARKLNAPDVFGSEHPDNAKLQATITEATLRRGSLGLIEAVRQAMMPASENLLVLVDQFEEIFRFAKTAKNDSFKNEAAAFVKLLLEAGRQRDVNIYVILTMRSDFLGDCALFRDLPEAINEGQYLVPRLTRDQLREAITGPIAVAGATITPRLLDRLLNDVGDDQDQLPVLQHALMRMWDNWEAAGRGDEATGRWGDKTSEGSGDAKRYSTRNSSDAVSPQNFRPPTTDHRPPIDLPHYEAIGCLTEALSRHADEAYDQLPDEHHRLIAEKIFKCLTEKGEDNREIRRPATLSELCAIASATEAETITVINAFRQEGRSFLMPPEKTRLHSDSLIDISHESLIRVWSRLSNWVDDEAQSARTYQRLAVSAVFHQKGEEDLLHGTRLRLDQEWKDRANPNQAWAQRYHPEFALAMDYLEKSRLTREQEAADEENRRKKALRNTQIAAAVFALAFLVGAVLAWYAYGQRNEALTQQQEALGQKKQFQKQKEIAEQLRGTAEQKTSEAQTAEQKAIEQKGIAEQKTNEAEEQAKIAKEEKTRAEMLARKAEEQRLIAENARHRADNEKLEAQKQRQLAFARQHAANAELNITGSGEDKVTGTLLAVESLRSTWTAEGYRAWAKGTAQFVRHPVENWIWRKHGKRVAALAISPDGNRLASLSNDNTFEVWEMQTGKEIFRHAVEVDPNYNAIAFSPNGRWLVTSAGQGVRVWNTSNDSKWSIAQELIVPGSPIFSIVFSPDSGFLAIANHGPKLQVYQTENWQPLTFPEEKDAQGDVRAVAFSGDNHYLFTGSRESLCVWKIALPHSPELIQKENHQGMSMALRPDGKRLITHSSKGALESWEVDFSGDTHVPLKFDREEKLEVGGTMLSISYSPDGKNFVTAPRRGGGYVGKLWRDLNASEVESVLIPLKTATTVFSPDGRWLFAGGMDGEITKWVVKSEPETRRLSHQESVNSIAFSPDGKWLATASDDHQMRIFEANEWKEVIRKDHNISVEKVAFVCGGKRLITLSASTIRVFKVGENWQELGQITPKEPILTRVALSPDRKRIAIWSRLKSTTSETKWIEQENVWDLNSLQLISTALQEYERVVGRNTPLPNKLRNTADGLTKEADTWSEINNDPASPNKQLLAQVDSDSVQLSESNSNAELAKVHHDGKVTDLAYSPDGRWLVTSSNDGTVRMWPLWTEDLIREACVRLLPRNLSKEEWKRYFGDIPYRETCSGLPTPEK